MLEVLGVGNAGNARRTGNGSAGNAGNAGDACKKLVCSMFPNSRITTTPCNPET